MPTHALTSMQKAWNMEKNPDYAIKQNIIVMSFVRMVT